MPSSDQVTIDIERPNTSRSRSRFAALGVLLVCCVLVSQRPLFAYSVLAHEGTVDALWDDAIVPLLKQRFPG